MNTYRVIFSPELEIDPATFATFWNSQPHLQDKGRIEVQSPQASAHYDMGELAMLVLGFLGGITSDIFKDLVKDAIDGYIKKHFPQTPEKTLPEFELIEKKTEDGKTLIIVLPKEEN